jgi:hypothetical protein
VSRDPQAGSALVAAAAVLGLLDVVLELVTHEGSGEGTDNAVAASLVSAKVPGSASTESAHETAVALALHGGIGGAVLLLARLAVLVLALGVLVLAVGTLLWILVVRLGSRILLLLLAVLTAKELGRGCSRSDGEIYPWCCCCCW